MSALRRRTPTPFWRLLTVLVAVGQLLVVGASWLDFAEGGRDQRTHVESAGTRQHYVHDDATCELCALQHLSGTPPAGRPRLAAAVPHAPAPLSGDQPAIARVSASATCPRAPPATV